MSHFSLLQDLSNRKSSEERRELLRVATEVLNIGPAASKQEITELDEMLGVVAREFSVQVRRDLARLIGGSEADFSFTAGELATHQIEVAEPILVAQHSLSEQTLLRVVDGCSQAHLMLVSKRQDVTAHVAHALVEKGEDDILVSLLRNESAVIALSTYEAIAERADAGSETLKAGLVRSKGVPLALLSNLYLRVEAELREEIVAKFGEMEESEVTAAFARTRALLTTKFRAVPGDFEPAQRRVRRLANEGRLIAPLLMTLLREGEPSRTTFLVAFSELADVEFEVIERITGGPDLDALALICRGAGFERALFMGLAVGLDQSGDGLSRTVEYAALFENVPASAAERALRFWKLRSSALRS